jgi:hypothetical protein
MPENYLYYYILNSKNNLTTQEVLIDFQELCEFDKFLEELPEYEPSNSVLEKTFKLI